MANTEIKTPSADVSADSTKLNSEKVIIDQPKEVVASGLIDSLFSSSAENIKKIEDTIKSVSEKFSQSFMPSIDRVSNAIFDLSITGGKNFSTLFAAATFGINTASNSLDVFADKTKGLGGQEYFKPMTEQLQEFVKSTSDINILENIYSKMGGGGTILNKGLEDAKKAVIDFAIGMTEGADHTIMLQQAFLSAAASRGELSKVMKQAGPDLENLNAITTDYNVSLKQMEKNTGLPLPTIAEYVKGLNGIKGIFDQIIEPQNKFLSGQTTIEGVMKMASAGFISHQSALSITKHAVDNLNLSGAGITDMFADIIRITEGTEAPMETVIGTVTTLATSFQYLGNQTKSFAENNKVFFEGLRQSGMSATQTISTINTLTEATLRLDTANRAYLSQKSGGPGGLQGALQIQLMMQEEGGSAKVTKMMMDTMKKDIGGKIITAQEGAKSQEGASQYQKQVAMLKARVGINDEYQAQKMIDFMSKGDITSASKILDRDSKKEELGKREEALRNQRELGGGKLQQATVDANIAQINAQALQLHGIQELFTASTPEQKAEANYNRAKVKTQAAGTQQKIQEGRSRQENLVPNFVDSYKQSVSSVVSGLTEFGSVVKKVSNLLEQIPNIKDKVGIAISGVKPGEVKEGEKEKTPTKVEPTKTESKELPKSKETTPSPSVITTPTDLPTTPLTKTTTPPILPTPTTTPTTTTSPIPTTPTPTTTTTTPPIPTTPTPTTTTTSLPPTTPLTPTTSPSTTDSKLENYPKIFKEVPNIPQLLPPQTPSQPLSKTSQLLPQQSTTQPVKLLSQKTLPFTQNTNPIVQQPSQIQTSSTFSNVTTAIFPNVSSLSNKPMMTEGMKKDIGDKPITVEEGVKSKEGAEQYKKQFDFISQRTGIINEAQIQKFIEIMANGNMTENHSMPFNELPKFDFSKLESLFLNYKETNESLSNISYTKTQEQIPIQQKENTYKKPDTEIKEFNFKFEGYTYCHKCNHEIHTTPNQFFCRNI